MVRECRPPAREPGRSWLARRSTMATSTPANANSPANISPVGPPPAITTGCSVTATLRPYTSTTTHAFRCPISVGSGLRPAIMRHAPGLAASPLGGINWKWRGAGNGLSLPVWCGRTTSSRSGDAPGTAKPPAQGDLPCAHGGRQPAGTLPPKFHDRTSTERRKASRSLSATAKASLIRRLARESSTISALIRSPKQPSPAQSDVVVTRES